MTGLDRSWLEVLRTPLLGLPAWLWGGLALGVGLPLFLAALRQLEALVDAQAADRRRAEALAREAVRRAHDQQLEQWAKDWDRGERRQAREKARRALDRDRGRQGEF